MFQNVGKKIKTLAKGIFWISGVGSIITGLVMLIFAPGAFFPQNVYTLLGLTTIITGPLSAYAGGILLYGFGELVDKAVSGQK